MGMDGEWKLGRDSLTFIGRLAGGVTGPARHRLQGEQDSDAPNAHKFDSGDKFRNDNG